VLATYEQERKPHARYMIGLALTIGWSMTAGGDVGSLIRRFVVPRLTLVPSLRTKLVDSRTPALRRSALVVKARRRRELAGTLCPNPLVADGSRLDAVLGNGFALITTIWPCADQRAALEDRGVVVHLAAPGSELARWLRRGRAVAALVRPDRTVMGARRGVTALVEAGRQLDKAGAT
jgi:3-(3-hydroxy-phenyl)propionate hydroxylase